MWILKPVLNVLLFFSLGNTLQHIYVPRGKSESTRPGLERSPLPVVDYAPPRVKKTMVPRVGKSPLPLVDGPSAKLVKREEAKTRKTFSLKGLDCRAPRTVSSVAASDACKGRRRSTKILSQHNVVIGQRVMNTVRAGYRCTKRVTKIGLIFPIARL